MEEQKKREVNVQFLILKAKVKGLAAEGHRTRNFINSSKGPKKDSHWGIKRQIGVAARNHLVAYGLLKGLDYWEIERSKNPPNAEDVAAILIEHSLDSGTVWTTEKVEGMLKPAPEVTPVRREKDAEKAAKARAEGLKRQAEVRRQKAARNSGHATASATPAE